MATMKPLSEQLLEALAVGVTSYDIPTPRTVGAHIAKETSWKSAADFKEWVRAMSKLKERELRGRGFDEAPFETVSVKKWRATTAIPDTSTRTLNDWLWFVMLDLPLSAKRQKQLVTLLKGL